MNRHRPLLVTMLGVTLFVSAVLWFSLLPFKAYVRHSSLRALDSGDTVAPSSRWSNVPEISPTTNFTVYLPLVTKNFIPPLVFQEVSAFGRYEVASIETADLDGDGNLELIVASEENNSIIQVYENLGNGVFRNSGNPFAFQSPDQRHWNFGIVVADFNGDGRPDIATADAWAGMNVYFNRGGLRFEWMQNFTFPEMGEVRSKA